MTTLRQLETGSLFAGEFEVLRPLAEGGMGAVYVARQRSTGRERALKVMHPQLVSDEVNRARFSQEAQVGGQIESDHIVQVVAAGVDAATGMPWLAMELLQGEDLATLVARRGALPPGDVREVFDQLGHALGSAHRVGIVHRDLKPENLFLATARRRGVAFTLKVLDLGIAKLVQDNRTFATATGAIGTPLWMAPEQTEARGQIGTATDVWPLGLIAFYLLTGKYYWKAANEPTASTHALLREIVLEPVEPASVRASELGAQARLPEGFDAWFARCVVRDVAGRFRTADLAIDALLPLLDGRPGEPLLGADAPTLGASALAGRGATTEIAAEPSIPGVAKTARWSGTELSTQPRTSPEAPPASGRGGKSSARTALVSAGLVVAIATAALVTRSSGRDTPETRESQAPREQRDVGSPRASQSPTARDGDAEAPTTAPSGPVVTASPAAPAGPEAAPAADASVSTADQADSGVDHPCLGSYLHPGGRDQVHVTSMDPARCGRALFDLGTDGQCNGPLTRCQFDRSWLRAVTRCRFAAGGTQGRVHVECSGRRVRVSRLDDPPDANTTMYDFTRRRPRPDR